jgi:diacylglycerol kinase (ATP)
MRKVALLFNPNSGGQPARRKSEIESVLALLRDANVEATLILCESAAEAQRQARLAGDTGRDTVLACGGDGTIHSVLQGLANSSVALGVLPMGTANALAHDLGLPISVVGAARAALQAVPRRVALGRIKFQDLQGNPGTRFFVVAAGAGVDAHLFYKLHTGTKRRMGMAAYYTKAWHMWFSYPMTRFAVEFEESGSGARRHAEVTELMAIRIRNFGGVLQELAPGASLDRDDVRLVFCRTASRFSYLLYVTRGLLRLNWNVPGIELAYSDRISCQYLSEKNGGETVREPIYVETDGELVGTLPVEITIVPDALTLLAPRR